MPRGTECAAQPSGKHDTTVPQEDHHVVPLSRGGPDTPGNTERVCCNAHSDVHYLLNAIERVAKPLVGLPDPAVTAASVMAAVPWSLVRTFGLGVRQIAHAGWRSYGPAFLAGTFIREAALWSSSGDPIVPNVPPYAVAVDLGHRAVAVGRPRAGEPYGEWLLHRFPAWRRLGLPR
jgi:hypothetical protein